MATLGGDVYYGGALQAFPAECWGCREKHEAQYNEDEMGNRTGASLSDHWGPLGEAAKVRDLQRSGFSQAQAIKMAKMR